MKTGARRVLFATNGMKTAAPRVRLQTAWRWLAAATVVLGCSGKVAGVAGESSVHGGSRLRPKVWRSSDGLRAVRSMFDTALGTDCRAAEDETGTLRCLPVGPSYLTSSGTYADEACTIPLMESGDGPAVPAASFSTEPVDTDGCDQRFRVRRLTRVDVVFAKYTGHCAPAGGSGFIVGEVMPASSFVRLEDVTTRRVQRPIHRGEDGSRIVVERDGVFDESVGVPCVFGVATDGLSRCLPAPTAFSVGWTEGCASGRLVLNASRTGCFPAVTEDTAPWRVVPGLLPPARVWRYGDRVTSYYDCGDRAPILAGSRDIRVAEEISPASFLPMTRTMLGGARLRATAYVVDGEPISDPFGYATTFHDEALGEDCTLESVSPSSMRCIPGYASAAFSDAACTRPVIVATTTRPPPYVLRRDEDNFVVSAWAVSDALLRTGALWSTAGGGCSATHGTYYDAPREVPLDTFVEVDEVVE